MIYEKSVAIIGGGIAGLTALYDLKRGGVNATLYERDSDYGGRVKNVFVGNVPVELGAAIFNKHYRSFLGLASELGLESKIIRSRRGTKIFKGGKLVYLSPLSFLLSGEFSVADKVSLAGLLFDVRRYAAAVERYVERLYASDEFDPVAMAESEGLLKESYSKSFADYLQKRVSVAVKNRVLEPGFRAMLAQSTDELNMFCGMATLIEASTPVLKFKDGMRTITQALYNDVADNVRLGEEVSEVSRDGNGYHVKTGNSGRRFDYVIATASMPALREIFPEISTGLQYANTTMVAIRGRLKKELDDGKSGNILIGGENGVENITRYSADVFTVTSLDGNPGLGKYFSDYDIVHSHFWKAATPKLSPDAEFPKPVDETGTFYLAGDFWLPCIEMSVQTARKAAKKIVEINGRNKGVVSYAR